MTLEQFIDCCAKERANLLTGYFTPGSGSQVAADIAALLLSDEQARTMRRIIGGVLTDSFYTLLLGLDGAASIGGRQEMFALRAEDGTQLTGSGKLEALAYERFHNVAYKSPQPTPVGVVSSADAGHAVVPAWLSFGR